MQCLKQQDRKQNTTTISDINSLFQMNFKSKF